MPTLNNWILFDFGGVIGKIPTFSGIFNGENNSFVEQMPAILKGLYEHYHLAIVSTGSEHSIKRILTASNQLYYFKEILGYESSGSKYDKIMFILNKYGLQPDRCVFVTDTSDDILEAQAAQIRAIGVGWGLGKLTELTKTGATAVVKSPAELEAVLKKLLIVDQ